MSNEKKRALNLDNRPLCKYGKECYRKNPTHFEEFRHPAYDSDTEDEDIKEQHPPAAKKQKLSRRTEMKAELSFYVTKAQGIAEKFNRNSVAIGIKDILSPSMGNLQASAQFNYMFEIGWLMEQYPKGKRSQPLLIIHGDQREAKAALEKEGRGFPNISFFQARLEAFGTHHSCPGEKSVCLANALSCLESIEGLRVVITTANLIERDWDQKTQGVWVSPLFPKLGGTSTLSSSSSTGADKNTFFKQDLLEYITAYGGTALDEWKRHIRKHDMSSARVRLIASVPGRHVGQQKMRWGHLKLRQTLQQYGPSSKDVQPTWPVVGQFSSIGSLGSDKTKWVCGEWLQSLASTSGASIVSKSPLQLIFPSVDNVRNSLEGYPAGGSIPYSRKTAAKQPWLPSLMCQWKADVCGRSRASPHIKSYTRISPDSSQVSWFLMTSSNLSKAAWGALEKNGQQLMIRSYEIGVLFLPGDQIPSQKYFPLSSKGDCDNNEGVTTIQLPFDVPVTPYTAEDKPWMWDVQYTDKPDSHGNIWCPPC